MKKKIKKIKILFLITFLGFFSCHPEADFLEHKHNQDAISVERISESQFKKIAPNAFGKIELLNQKKSQTQLQKTVSINNEFTVNTQEIIQITKNNKVSYTLQINRTIDNGLVENLVLTRQKDNSFSAKIVTYHLTTTEKTMLQNGLYVNVSQKMQVLDYSNTTLTQGLFSRQTDISGSCFIVTQTGGNVCPSGKHNYTDMINDKCDYVKSGLYTPALQAVYTITFKEECNETGGGGAVNYDGLDSDNPHGGTGDGSGGTGTTPPDDPNPNDPNEPVDDFEDNTLPILNPNINTTPCDELKLNSNNAVFKMKMDSLKNNINGSKEKAFAIYNGNYVNSTYPNPSCGNIKEGTSQHTENLPYHTSMKAIGHNHLEDSIHKHIGTFSPDDITSLTDIVQKSLEFFSPVKKEEFAYYLTCKEGNYAIKVTDINKLQMFLLAYSTNAKYIEKIKKFYLDNNMVHGKPKKEQNIGFLNFLKNFQIGIEYYEADENFENWQKLELNPSGNDITKTPC